MASCGYFFIIICLHLGILIEIIKLEVNLMLVDGRNDMSSLIPQKKKKSHPHPCYMIEDAYSKTCLKRSLKNRQNKGLKDEW